MTHLYIKYDYSIIIISVCNSSCVAVLLEIFTMTQILKKMCDSYKKKYIAIGFLKFSTRQTMMLKQSVIAFSMTEETVLRLYLPKIGLLTLIKRREIKTLLYIEYFLLMYHYFLYIMF